MHTYRYTRKVGQVAFSAMLRRVMYTAVHMYICMYVYMYTYMCIFVFMHVCICEHMCICVYEFMHVCIHEHMYICVFEFMHICIYEPMYICVYEFLNLQLAFSAMRRQFKRVMSLIRMSHVTRVNFLRHTRCHM